MDRIQRKCPNN